MCYLVLNIDSCNCTLLAFVLYRSLCWFCLLIYLVIRLVFNTFFHSYVCFLTIVYLLVSFRPSLKPLMWTFQSLHSATLTHHCAMWMFQSHATTRVFTPLVWCSGCLPVRCCACVAVSAVRSHGRLCLICTSTEILKRYVTYWTYYYSLDLNISFDHFDIFMINEVIRPWKIHLNLFSQGNFCQL